MAEADDITAYVDRVEGQPPVEVIFPAAGSVQQVRVYALDHPAHWHVVTVGLAALGFELTFRVEKDDEMFPGWAVDLLANLAAYIFGSGHEFAPGHHVDLRGPIKLDERTDITAAALAPDGKLGKYDGVEFLQIVGLTAEELELCRAWRTEGVLGLLARNDPLFVTRLERKSVLDDPALRDQAETGIASDGSALEELHVATLAWARRGWNKKRLVVFMGAGAATGLGPALRRKLNRTGASFRVVGDGVTVQFGVTEGAQWRLVNGDVLIEVPLGAVDDLAGMFTGEAGSGTMEALPGLRFVIRE